MTPKKLEERFKDALECFFKDVSVIVTEEADSPTSYEVKVSFMVESIDTHFGYNFFHQKDDLNAHHRKIFRDFIAEKVHVILKQMEEWKAINKPKQ